MLPNKTKQQQKQNQKIYLVFGNVCEREVPGQKSPYCNEVVLQRLHKDQACQEYRMDQYSLYMITT